MKKFFISSLAVASMLFAASCTNETELVSQAGESAMVSFQVSTPEMATRAYSDGTTATHLQYAVYDEDGDILPTFTVTNGEIKGSATVNFKLSTKNTYSVVFWAAAPNAPYTVDFDNKTMTVNYDNALSNAENRDAFYAFHTFTVNGVQTEKITLKRPFAQLNIGTNDYQDSENAGYTPDQSSVTIKNVYSTLDLFEGTVDGETEATFKLAPIGKDETFPVNGYKYLAMNYFLVSSDKELVEVEYNYTDGHVADTRIIGSVPVQRNYRTNIYGSLLTSDVDVEVEIEPAFDEPAHELDALYKAAAFGGEITLENDVKLTSPLNIQANLKLNLNGKTLTGSINVAEDAALTVEGGSLVNTDNKVSGITSNGNLTLNNVEITSARHALRIESGEVVINGGIYKVDPISKSTLHALNVGDNNTVAKVTIKGGTFIGPKGTTADSGAAVNVRSGSSVTIEGGNFSGGKKNTLSVGGTMEIKGGTFDQNPSNYVASDYKAIEKDGKWYVVPGNATAIVLPNDDLNAAVATANATIWMQAGTYTFPAGFAEGVTLDCTDGVTFAGTSKLNINGATVIGATFSNPTGTAADQTINGTFKDCTFTGANALRYCYAGETVVFEDCVFDGSTYGVHFDGGANDVKFINCTLSGFNAFGAALENVTFNGCTFKGNGKSGYNGANLWGSATMINCEFTFDGSTANEWIDCIGVDKNYIFEGCTLNGGSIFTGEYIFSRNSGTKATIDDVEYTYTEKYWKNAEDNVAITSTTAALQQALADGDNVVLANDIAVQKSDAVNNGYGAVGISQLNGGVIDGNGNDVSVDAWGTWDSAINTTGGTIKNVNVTGGMRGIFINHNGTNNSKVILENVTIDGTIYTISCDQGNNQGLEATNCTFNGWTSYAATIGDVKFNNCTFGAGNGYNFSRPYAPTEYVNCTFEAGHQIDPRAAVTFENCTFNGVDLTAENLSELVTSNIANATVK